MSGTKRKLLSHLSITKCLLLIVVCFVVNNTFSQKILTLKGTGEIALGKHVNIFIDTLSKINEQQVLQVSTFDSSKKDVPVSSVSKGTVWVRFTLTNQADGPSAFLNIPYYNISFVDFYKVENGVVVKKAQSGNGLKFSGRKIATNHVFNLELSKGDTATYFVKVRSNHPIILPLFINSTESLEYLQTIQTIVTGIYIGILLAIILYNLFLFLSTKDKNYFIYISYLFFLGLAQLILSGYAFEFLWPSLPAINQYAVIISSALAGILAIVFGIYFLRTKHYLPKFTKVLFALMLLYVIAIIATLLGYNFIGYEILNYTSLAGGVILIVIAWKIAEKGYRPAYFYLVAWISFLLGMVVFVLRNLNVLPYNFFTTYILYAGSAIEAILLSIALADKINTLRKEKEVSQAEALKISQENERLVREQNLELEHKVSERTQELQFANQELTSAYTELEGAQIQLVEAEKMASLGQLTAGIAHEINNPINFVKSNIKPLKLDIRDMIEVIDEYEKLHHTGKEELQQKLESIERLKAEIDLNFVKTEIENLMTGIEEGAERTAEIVRGLRTFSRLDESQIKVVNIHEGIDSTLVLLRSHIPMNIQVIKDFDADGNIECFPGKLNQVFMNVINNAIQAIKEKEKMSQEEFILIATKDKNENEIEIRIKDSGIGMTDEVKKKIFDPFFTTKDVGEGTGLGLAIVFKIVKEHGGRINVVSTPGEGSEFVITLLHAIPSAAF